MNRVLAVAGTDVEKQTGDIILALTGDKEQTYGLQITRGVVAIMVTTLVGQFRRSQKDYPGGPEFQPATLTGFRKFVHSDGRMGIEFVLDGGLPLGVLIDPSVSRGLRSELLKLEELSSSPDNKQPKH